jgi:hypothetical protein
MAIVFPLIFKFFIKKCGKGSYTALSAAGANPSPGEKVAERSEVGSGMREIISWAVHVKACCNF